MKEHLRLYYFLDFIVKDTIRFYIKIGCDRIFLKKFKNFKNSSEFLHVEIFLCKSHYNFFSIKLTLCLSSLGKVTQTKTR